MRSYELMIIHRPDMVESDVPCRSEWRILDRNVVSFRANERQTSDRQLRSWTTGEAHAVLPPRACDASRGLLR